MDEKVIVYFVFLGVAVITNSPAFVHGIVEERSGAVSVTYCEAAICLISGYVVIEISCIRVKHSKHANVAVNG